MYTVLFCKLKHRHRQMPKQRCTTLLFIFVRCGLDSKQNIVTMAHVSVVSALVHCALFGEQCFCVLPKVSGKTVLSIGRHGSQFKCTTNHIRSMEVSHFTYSHDKIVREKRMVRMVCFFLVYFPYSVTWNEAYSVTVRLRQLECLLLKYARTGKICGKQNA